MPLQRFLVTVRTEKSGGGTFKSSDEVGEQIREAIEGSDPGSVDVDGVTYDVTDFEVDEYDEKGVIVPWTDEAEARSKARADEEKKRHAKRQAEAKKENEKYRAEQEKRRNDAAARGGRVYHSYYDHDSPGMTKVEEEIVFDKYDDIVFEVPPPQEGWEPVKVEITRSKQDPSRIDVRIQHPGHMRMIPRDSTTVQFEAVAEW